MRSVLLILGLALTAGATTGCATQSPAQSEIVQRPFGLPYEPSASAALAFEPPIAMNVPLPSFARDGRALEAFAGYEEPVTTFSYTHQRDEIEVRGEFGDFTRRAYTDRVSVMTR